MGGQKWPKTATKRAPRTFTRPVRARFQKKQRHSVGHSTLSTCTNFHPNCLSFATNSFKNTRTEAITLREAGPAKPLSVGPSGPKKSKIYSTTKRPTNSLIFE